MLGGKKSLLNHNTKCCYDKNVLNRNTKCFSDKNVLNRIFTKQKYFTHKLL